MWSSSLHKDCIILSDNDEIDWVEDAGATGDAGVELNASGENEYGALHYITQAIIKKNLSPR